PHRLPAVVRLRGAGCRLRGRRESGCADPQPGLARARAAEQAMTREHAQHHHAPVHDGHDPHGHGPVDLGRAFAIGIVLNTGFVVIEAIYGWYAGSLALLADAGHNLSDVAGLILAWAALVAGRLRPTERHTYGWRRGSILAAFINAVALLEIGRASCRERVERLVGVASRLQQSRMMIG